MRGRYHFRVLVEEEGEGGAGEDEGGAAVREAAGVGADCVADVVGFEGVEVGEEEEDGGQDGVAVVVEDEVPGLFGEVLVGVLEAGYELVLC